MGLSAWGNHYHNPNYIMKNTIIALAASAIALSSVSAQTLGLGSTTLNDQLGNSLLVQRTSDGAVFRIDVDSNQFHTNLNVGTFGGNPVPGSSSPRQFELTFTALSVSPNAEIGFSDFAGILPVFDIDVDSNFTFSVSGGSATDLIVSATNDANISSVVTDLAGASVGIDFDVINSDPNGRFSVDLANNTGTFDTITWTGTTDFIGAAYTLDGFTVTTIPEPSSALLLGLGAFGLLGRRKR